MERLAGTFALVTGAGGGLGSAIAELFAREGAVVGVNDTDHEAAESVAKRCRLHSPRSEAMVADVSDRGAVQEMFAHLSANWGRLDILVNNAGVSATADVAEKSNPLERGIDDITDIQWDRMIGVHLNGTFYCTRAAVPLMAAGGRGSIVCMSSIAGLSGFGPIHYSAAKGGILGLVRALARSVGPAGIRVNAICPGAIDAGMTKAHAPEVRQAIVPSIPLRRLGSADDIAYAALYLASDESAYTTGQWLSPNGGLVIS
jgi:3-oxoacyl-[acyl-carrier protein] reductase